MAVSTNTINDLRCCSSLRGHLCLELECMYTNRQVTQVLARVAGMLVAVHVPGAAANCQQYVLVNKLLNCFAGVLTVSLPQDRCQLFGSPGIVGPADMPSVQGARSTFPL